MQAEQQAAHESMSQEARSVAAARASAEEEADRVRQDASRLQQRQHDLEARIDAFDSQASQQLTYLSRHWDLIGSLGTS